MIINFCLGGGWAGTGFFMDPTTGIAVVSGAQVVLATGNDVELHKVNRKLESTLYQGLKFVTVA